MFAEFVNKLIFKSHFPKVKSIDYEFKKAGLLRVLLGVIIFVRFYQIANDYVLYYGEYSLFGILNLLLIFFFTIGFSLPITTVLLIVFVRFSDGFAATSTLGTTILVQTLLLFLFINSCEYYALDNILIKRKNLLSRVLRFQYSILGRHNKISLTKLYFFIFFIYALISLGAILIHVQDYYWINGLTVKSLFSNSYLSLYFDSFRWLESNYPKLVSLFSIVAGIFQSIFQLLMVFLVFFKAGNFFVKWWGMQFFIISLFVINLSYLPHIEIILWILIFFPLNIKEKNISSSKFVEINKHPFSANKLNDRVFNFFYSAYSIVLVVFIFVCFPYISNHTSNILGNKKSITRNLLYRSGLEIPHVFNNTDLSMGDCWMVIYRKMENSNTWDLVPITAENGKRLSYSGSNVFGFSNHNSDFLYFSTSLVYRRKIINIKNYKKFHDQGFGRESIEKRIRFDYKKQELLDTYLYKIIVYKNNSSKVIHWKKDVNRHEKIIVYTDKLGYNGLHFFKFDE